jgi:hypothetical protein
MHRHPKRTLLAAGLLACCLFGPFVIVSGDQPPGVGPDAGHRRISGVYPHLTTYGIYSQEGAHLLPGHDECGIGAVVPWADRLWMINYAPHKPQGSEHKLYSVDRDLNLTIHPESVGGTPAARMIHRESNQLLIGPYLIDDQGRVRVIPPSVMPGRLTAIARHLNDPANMVYYIDMEGMIYEADVHTLEVTRLFQKPVPGWHSKGGYTGQGRLVISNNGERSWNRPGTEKLSGLEVADVPPSPENIGVLAEWDGRQWQIVERRQYTDVTGPGGIYGTPNDQAPLWAIGWDRRSLRLKLLDGGCWSTFLLPKAAHNNDPAHGWYTEWPRIREIGNGRMLMDMHGMFFDFPATFSAADTSGLQPVASHLRYIPDFCEWNGRLVLASDETSIQGNPLAGQPQSNLWFGTYDDLQTWGPATGYGGPWVADPIQAAVYSDPFLVGGFDRAVLHLALGAAPAVAPRDLLRATDQQPITGISPVLANLPRVTVRRGDWHQPAPGYSFTVDQRVTVYLAVDQRGNPELDQAWAATDLQLTWGQNHQDRVYRRTFAPGLVEIPDNATEHTPGAFGMPHTAFVSTDGEDLTISPSAGATVTRPEPPERTAELATASGPVQFTLEIDARGDGTWTDYRSISVPADGYAYHVFPPDFAAQWVRIKTDKDCIATAYFHLTDADPNQASPRPTLFAGLADVGTDPAHHALVYAAKRNRNLRVITGQDRHFDFTKQTFQFQPQEADPELKELLEIEPEFTVDDASVIITAGGQRLRLPKGPAAFDRPLAAGWPRGSREVESERHLGNFHGTFYEIPLITNGRPPAFALMRPVASHTKQIFDFCTWNGLLVLSGVRVGARPDEHVCVDDAGHAGLWFGAIDDLWQLGKPVGQGGPWQDSQVTRGQPSDPYLMTGYDRKTLALTADRDVQITVEVDVDHHSGWHLYQVFPLRAGATTTHEFPTGYSAHWLRVIADQDCRATAQLSYE